MLQVSSLRGGCFGLLLGLTAGLASGSPAAATFDRLQEPALISGRATEALLLDIVRAGERLVTVGEQGTVLLSDDRGRNWRQARVPVSTLLTAVAFVDADLGWAVGHDGTVLHTRDGGENWTLQLEGDAINRSRVEQLERELEALQQRATADSTLLEDVEFALEDARYALEEGPSTPLLDVWFRNAREGFVLGAYGQLLHTRDGGQSWRSLGHRLPNPDRFHLNALLATSGGDLYIAGEAGLLLRSRDGGERWEALASPYEGSWFALVEHQGLYLMGLRGHLYHSAAGDDWAPVDSGTRATLSQGLVAGERLILLGQGGALLIGDSVRGFEPLGGRGRQSLSAGLVTDQRLLLVGESGIRRQPLPEGLAP
ncbi:WD40/YVTN/BNR-like repeat-containing protein [Marinobacterium aestuariivivens]|uniref:WD40/YVTN/BNR-like repeat-containing protein n=1 Tax=Marinobacterium aestuariivivens TaxID=1698799 RepID=A0ABW2A1Q5_9GAMM